MTLTMGVDEPSYIWTIYSRFFMLYTGPLRVYIKKFHPLNYYEVGKID